LNPTDGGKIFAFQIWKSEKRLQVYGELITILESCARKMTRQNLNTPDPQNPEQVISHLLENPYDTDRLQIIFEKSHYLLSTELLEEWYKFVKADEFFQVLTARQKGEGNLRADFRKMQEIAENEYGDLNNQYDSLVEPEDNRNPEKTFHKAGQRRIRMAEIILIVIIVSSVSGLVYLLSPSGDSSFFGFVQPHVKTIKNPLDSRENMTLVINLHSATFGQGGRSGPFVSLYPDVKFRNNSTNNAMRLPPQYLFEIDGTYCGTTIVSYLDPVENCSFPLVYSQSNGRYEGYKDNVRFAQFGIFDVHLFTKEDKSDATSVGEKFILVSDITPVIGLRIFKLTTILGVVGVIVATVAIYQQHRK